MPVLLILKRGAANVWQNYYIFSYLCSYARGIVQIHAAKRKAEVFPSSPSPPVASLFSTLCFSHLIISIQYSLLRENYIFRKRRMYMMDMNVCGNCGIKISDLLGSFDRWINSPFFHAFTNNESCGSLLCSKRFCVR